MVKKVRWAAMEPSPPPSSSYQTMEDARIRAKHRSLIDDYLALLKDTEAKKKKLRKTIEKKRKLLAEVKFLRGKYNSFVKNPRQEICSTLKKPSHRILPPSLRMGGESDNLISQSEFPPTDRIHKVKKVAAPRKSIDLNQICLQSDEEMQECQANQASRMDADTCTSNRGLKGEKRKRRLNKEAISNDANDVNPLMCEGVEKSSNRMGKRKASWQDPLSWMA